MIGLFCSSISIILDLTCGDPINVSYLKLFCLYIVLGDEDPYISGASMTYQLGDLVSAVCTSAASDPPSVVTWYVNNKQVHSSL